MSVRITPAHSSQNKLKNRLDNNKDKLADLDKSGIYKMKCETCGKFYIGETCRPCHKRCDEHMKAIEDEDFTSSVSVVQ